MKKIILLMAAALFVLPGRCQMAVFDAASTTQLITLGGSIAQQVEMASGLLDIAKETKQIRTWITAGLKTAMNVNEVIQTTSRAINNANRIGNLITKSKVLNPKQALNLSRQCLATATAIKMQVKRLNQLVSDNFLDMDEGDRLTKVDAVGSSLALQEKQLDRIEASIRRQEQQNVLVRIAQSQNTRK